MVTVLVAAAADRSFAQKVKGVRAVRVFVVGRSHSDSRFRIVALSPTLSSTLQYCTVTVTSYKHRVKKKVHQTHDGFGGRVWFGFLPPRRKRSSERRNAKRRLWDILNVPPFPDFV